MQRDFALSVKALGVWMMSKLAREVRVDVVPCVVGWSAGLKRLDEGIVSCNVSSVCRPIHKRGSDMLLVNVREREVLITLNSLQRTISTFQLLQQCLGRIALEDSFCGSGLSTVFQELDKVGEYFVGGQLLLLKGVYRAINQLVTLGQDSLFHLL